MRRQLLSIASAVVLLLAAAGAQAADPPAQTNPPAQPSAQTSVSGTVVSSSTSSLVIRGDAGDQTFVVDSNTMVPETMSPGMKVTVDFKLLADGRKQATRVTATKADTGSDPKTKAK